MEIKIIIFSLRNQDKINVVFNKLSNLFFKIKHSHLQEK